MLRQDPVECLFSFICSSNNHISRIKGMVDRLCSAYGTRLPVIAPDVASKAEAQVRSVHAHCLRRCFGQNSPVMRLWQQLHVTLPSAAADVDATLSGSLLVP